MGSHAKRIRVGAGCRLLQNNGTRRKDELDIMLMH